MHLISVEYIYKNFQFLNISITQETGRACASFRSLNNKIFQSQYFFYLKLNGKMISIGIFHDTLFSHHGFQ